MKQNRKWISCILGCLLSFGISAYADEPGVSATEIIIGMHSNESGAGAAYSAISRAMTAYFDRLNEQGGIYGRKIKFLRIDVQSKMQLAIQATRKLVEEEHIFAMVGGQGLQHMGVYKYLYENGVPDLYFLEGLKDYFTPFKKTTFSGVFPYKYEAQAYADWVVQTHPGKKMCFLITNEARGEEYLEGLKTALDEANKKLSDAQKIKIGPVQRVDFTAVQANDQVLNLKRENCDIVFHSGTDAGLVPNSMIYGLSHEFKPVWIVTFRLINPTFLSLLPPTLKDGVISSSATLVDPDPGNPDWASFEKLMKKENIPISRVSIIGYVLADAFAETVRRAGKDLTRAKLVEAAETLSDWKCGLCAVPVAITPKFHALFAKPKLFISKDGRWLPL